MKVVQYTEKDGTCPYRKWIKKLDTATRARIQARVFRFEQGNLGDYKSVGKGVLEARIFLGPGYRLYFGMEQGEIIILLVGGDKSTQEKDIRKSQKYWVDYLENNHEQKK